MKKRKWYHNIAKRSKSANDWNAYCRIKNCINYKIKKRILIIITRCLTTLLVATVDNSGIISEHNTRTIIVSPP